MTAEATPRSLELPPPTGEPRTDALRRLLAIVDRLRAPDGCPWDREQTIESMAPSLVEEAHEMVEAIETGSDDGTVEEAGDLLMVVMLICRIAEQEGRFDLARAATLVGDKLIRRHPHVFGDAKADSSAHVVANWEKIKAAEREDKQVDASALAGVPGAMPALQRANRLAAKAIAAGFKWDDPEGALRKVEEELAELREACAAGDRERMQAELGDLLIASAFVGNYLELDAERATRDSLRRFEARFRAMEAKLDGRLREAPLEELLAAWRVAKAETG